MKLFDILAKEVKGQHLDDALNHDWFSKHPTMTVEVTDLDVMTSIARPNTIIFWVDEDKMVKNISQGDPLEDVWAEDDEDDDVVVEVVCQ